MRRLLPPTLGLLALGFVAAGCDTSTATTATLQARPATHSMTIPLDGRPSADVYYDLATPGNGERFEATLVGSAGSLRLRFEGTGGGRGTVMLVADGRRLGDVSLDYLYAGDVVGKSPVGQREPYVAGKTDREPDSVHYVTYPDGGVEIIYDYDDRNDLAGPGTTVTAPTGSTMDVTHIRYRVEKAGVGTPQRLDFDSETAFALR